jgi:hypothetical protein
VGRTLLSDAFDLAVDLALVVDVAVAHVGWTLLSDVFDVELVAAFPARSHRRRVTKSNMAGKENSQEPQDGLSERVEQYRREIQSLIEQGVEHPRFEFKRSCSISRDNLDDRLDFIRFLQGVANAEVAGERCITIGADPKEKRFYPVSNTAEFDPAPVASIVSKVSRPTPPISGTSGRIRSTIPELKNG